MNRRANNEVRSNAARKVLPLRYESNRGHLHRRLGGEYHRWDYFDLMNTTFSLVVAGRQGPSGTYRFLESMIAGTIPVLVTFDTDRCVCMAPAYSTCRTLAPGRWMRILAVWEAPPGRLPLWVLSHQPVSKHSSVLCAAYPPKSVTPRSSSSPAPLYRALLPFPRDICWERCAVHIKLVHKSGHFERQLRMGVSEVLAWNQATVRRVGSQLRCAGRYNPSAAPARGISGGPLTPPPVGRTPGLDWRRARRSTAATLPRSTLSSTPSTVS